jgi:hypothetical protein
VVAKTKEAAMHGKELVEDAVGRVNLFFNVPTNVVGSLIGKGGSVIRMLENGK